MCGIIGIFNYQESNFIILELLEGLRKLQNRGRDSYGILLSNSENKIIIKEKELITIEKIKEMNLYDLKFNKVLGHSRYSTSYNTMESKNDCNNSHPFPGLNKNLGTFHLVHNGNINFNSSIKELYPKLNDTKILVKIIEKEEGNTWREVIGNIIKTIPGIYNVILSTKDKVIAFKDRYNMRPLCLGKNKYGFCIASESVALKNYEYLKEIKGGQIVEISDMGIKTFNVLENEYRICLFEFIYFLNPKSKFNNIEVLSLRHSLGNELAREESYHIDIKNKDNIVVIGSPDTGIPSGQGFAESLDLCYQQFLEKNKNRGRSFILGDDKSRAEECNKKFLVNPDYSINDKIVFFIDDSIVRGNTTKRIITLLKEYGAREIHIRISSPKIIDICKFGIDIPTKEELVMNRMNEKQYEEEYQIQSLRYLSLDRIESVIGDGLGISRQSFCNGCFGGGYQKELLDW
jgi:amidophosphoribosyltransferase